MGGGGVEGGEEKGWVGGFLGRAVAVAGVRAGQRETQPGGRRLAARQGGFDRRPANERGSADREFARTVEIGRGGETAQRQRRLIVRQCRMRVVVPAVTAGGGGARAAQQLTPFQTGGHGGPVTAGPGGRRQRK